jgi:hypothetical protein
VRCRAVETAARHPGHHVVGHKPQPNPPPLANP